MGLRISSVPPPPQPSLRPVPPPRPAPVAREQEAAPPLPEDWRYLSPTTRGVLRRTPPARWSLYALLLDGEDRSRVMTRRELAAWLRASDLPGLAHEATTRRVPPGCILALRLRDDGPAWWLLDSSGAR